MASKKNILSVLGVNEEAQEVVSSLLMIAAILAVAIVWAWQVYGSSIAELYDERGSPPPSKLRPLSLGEPALSSTDWTHTWHASRRDQPRPVPSYDPPPEAKKTR